VSDDWQWWGTTGSQPRMKLTQGCGVGWSAFVMWHIWNWRWLSALDSAVRMVSNKFWTRMMISNGGDPETEHCRSRLIAYMYHLDPRCLSIDLPGADNDWYPMGSKGPSDIPCCQRGPSRRFTPITLPWYHLFQPSIRMLGRVTSLCCFQVGAILKLRDFCWDTNLDPTSTSKSICDILRLFRRLPVDIWVL